ncbi:tetratricopeptide repeat protein [Parachitinimonas caeni]|uniref:Tetratricopeptide repeat protein n=1 Tax=Parachitinimonas caeni TaxID=3031301 RepID=A0ABT7E3X9_9NEIS|nr:tetratricopeptide repeat protein [Parachitinimonas caeni]MDK2127026.1 tetratricopeptide repeat protein [Parachitinimonas caeni]
MILFLVLHIADWFSSMRRLIVNFAIFPYLLALGVCASAANYPTCACLDYIAKSDMKAATKECNKNLKDAQRSGNKAQIAIAKNNIGMMLFRQGDYIKAEEFFRFALVMSQEANGPEHPYVTIPMSNLSVLYLRNKKIDEGGLLLEKSSKIVQKYFGDKPSQFKVGVLDAAVAYNIYKKSFVDAARDAEEIVELNQLLYGGESTKVAEANLLLSMVYEKSGNHELQLKYAKVAVDIYRKINDLRGKALALVDVSDALLYLGKTQDALQESQLAVEILKAAPVVSAQDRIRVNSGLAMAYLAMNQLDEALSYYTTALRYCDAKSGADVDNIFAIEERRAFVKYKMKNYDEAAIIYLRAYDLYPKTSKFSAFVARDLVERLVSSLMRSKNYIKALVYFDHLLDFQREILGRDHITVGYTLGQKGIALGNLKRWGETEEAMQEALSILKRNNASSAHQIAVIDWLIIAANALGKKDEVRKFIGAQEILRKSEEVTNSP